MADPMRIRATMVDNKVDVKILMAHPMETGQRKNPDGTLVPAHYIDTVTVTCKGKTVLMAEWGPSVSRNPYLAFRFTGAAKGDTISVTWKDNHGDTRTDEAAIA
ncbi:sulfur compound chelating protein SoxZ [Fontimonas thermophila]|uniref:Sulfur compound chelating protein SoxZ n=1 Tax=Fontimonas thermophila TaxID=1076937 RepID=A0A1I2IU82_9GAMM|nr:thiosulfate oxidation carrier complex protein SoxZ [Fontimonas thermophila]SFF45854.1 sulfur compound chelating protein SoxZ [Fontimonas thermophila]